MNEAKRKKRTHPNGFHFKRFTGKKKAQPGRSEEKKKEGLTQRMKRAFSKAKAKVERKKIIVRNTFSTINFELLNTRQQPRQQRLNEPKKSGTTERNCSEFAKKKC